VQLIEHNPPEGALGASNLGIRPYHALVKAGRNFFMKSLSFPLILTLTAFAAPELMAQTTVSLAPAGRYQAPAWHLAPQHTAVASTFRSAGYPQGPTSLPYPLVSTPANDAWARNNAWAAYNAGLRQIPTAQNPNRLAPRQNLLDEDRFIQKPQSSHRYNFQFSDNEIRSVQAALKRLGIYAGQVDGILGPDTRRAIEDYQIRANRPVTGQPDQSLNALLGIF
jgi:Putative peptidoglycan binding domain